jgi:hypothetical protein
MFFSTGLAKSCSDIFCDSHIHSVYSVDLPMKITKVLTVSSLEFAVCPPCSPYLVPASVRMAWKTSAACREQATAQRTASGAATRKEGPRNRSEELDLHVEGW